MLMLDHPCLDNEFGARLEALLSLNHKGSLFVVEHSCPMFFFVVTYSILENLHVNSLDFLE